MNNILQTNTLIQRSDGLVEAVIDGEVVMMSLDSGEYYGLDVIASRIWEIIEKPTTVKAICDYLLNDFDVSAEQCVSDVIEFLNDMSQHNIISAA